MNMRQQLLGAPFDFGLASEAACQLGFQRTKTKRVLGWTCGRPWVLAHLDHQIAPYAQTGFAQAEPLFASPRFMDMRFRNALQENRAITGQMFGSNQTGRQVLCT